MEKIVTIIVTYNGDSFIEQCLTSIINGCCFTQIIVVDNGSTDLTLDILKKFCDHIDLILLGKNYGFGHANNIGIEYALAKYDPDYFFLLNQDTLVYQDTLLKLRDKFLKNRYGILSPLHQDLLGKLDYNFKIYAEKNTEYWSDALNQNSQRIYSVPMINAAAWFMSKECILKVGGFDTSLFFHYGEDDNYCQRVLYHGLRIGFTPESKIIHLRSNEKRNPDSLDILDKIFRNRKVAIANVLITDEESSLLYRKHINLFYLIVIKSLILLKFKKILFLMRKVIQGEIFYKRKFLYSKFNNRIDGLISFKTST